MSIKAKVQFIQITTSDVKLNIITTDNAEETEIKLGELKDNLRDAGISYEGMELEDVPEILTLKDSNGQPEYWVATEMDLQAVYESNKLNVYDLYITYKV